MLYPPIPYVHEFSEAALESPKDACHSTLNMLSLMSGAHSWLAHGHNRSLPYGYICSLLTLVLGADIVFKLVLL